MIAVDSSVIIAGLLGWHEFHERAAASLEKALARKHLLIPFPALVESYSVMTRLPSSHRVRSDVAYQLLHDSFGQVRVAALPANKAWPFLRDCQASEVAGGRTYDALIAIIAIEAGASEILTFNPRHFDSFSALLRVTVP